MDILQAKDFFLSANARKWQPRTRDWYDQQLTAWINWLVENGITGLDWLEPDTLDLFFDEQSDTVAPSTVDARYRALRAFFKFLKKRNKLGSYAPPTDHVERPKLAQVAPAVADWHALQKVLGAMGLANWLDARDRCLLQLLMSTGLRINEAVNVRISQIDTRDGFVYIEHGKGAKARIVPYGEPFRQAFTAYLFNRPAWRGDDWLFLAADGHRRPVGQVTTNSARQVLRWRCRAAGVAYQRPHAIRHMCAITWLNDEMPLSAVSTMLGHSSVSFTAKVYAKWVRSGLRRQYDQATKRTDAGYAWRNA